MTKKRKRERERNKTSAKRNKTSAKRNRQMKKNMPMIMKRHMRRNATGGM